MGERVCFKCKKEIPDGAKSWYGLDGYECEACSIAEAAEYPKACRLIDGPICLGVNSKLGIILSDERARSLYRDLGKALHEEHKEPELDSLAELINRLNLEWGEHLGIGITADANYWVRLEICGAETTAEAPTVRECLEALLAKLPGREGGGDV